MKIISSFHDYYDCIQKYGQTDLVFNRVTNSFEEQKLDLPYISYLPSNFRDYIIGFCGKLYPLIKYSRNYFDYEKRSYDSENHYCYNFEYTDTLIQEKLKKKELKDYLNNRRWRAWQTKQKEIKEYFNAFNNRYDDYFHQYGSPILLFIYNRKWTVIINPQLKAYNFQKVFEPYQCFQEISMFLSNIAQPVKPIPHISDEIMCEIKGFDKWSFRKEKSSAC